MDKILLIISGGIAAYKSLELIRLFKKTGMQVKCVATQSAMTFITSASVEYLSGNSLRTSLEDREQEMKMGHIELARWPDLVLVAPATANIISSTANGLATDLAQTILMATTKQIVFAPSMNVRMWENKLFQKNIEVLKSNGSKFIGPTEGAMACGEYGMGRMMEPQKIIQSLIQK
jgi:phosphopantothenoylcysteine decarboxylase/phosphopantothenate--cysteine ligase